MRKPAGLPPKLARLGEKALLRHLLSQLEALERDWADAARRERALEAARRLASGALSAGIELPPGSRDLARRLRATLEPRELASLIVPLERALDRRVRDEDFLPVTDRSEPRAARMPVCVVADSLRSAWNVGGVFRTAECFGVEEVLLSGYSAGPDDPRVARAAMGTDRLVAWSRRPRRAGAPRARSLRDRPRDGRGAPDPRLARAPLPLRGPARKRALRALALRRCGGRRTRPHPELRREGVAQRGFGAGDRAP
jgi:hypothetical protein